MARYTVGQANAKLACTNRAVPWKYRFDGSRNHSGKGIGSTLDLTHDLWNGRFEAVNHGTDSASNLAYYVGKRSFDAGGDDRSLRLN